jgi:hypothetical protein
MYFNKPVMVRIGEDFYWEGEQIGPCECVMELDKAKKFIRIYKKWYKKYAYINWLENEKSRYECMLCGEDNPNALVYHHLGKKYTGLSKTDRIANMVANQLPLYVIVNEMSKCTILCATCHQKIEREGDEARDDVYDIYNRLYGRNIGDTYHAPGDETWETLENRMRFSDDMTVPIEIVGSFEPSYLKKYGMEEGMKSYLVAVDDDIYWENRCELRRIERGNK